MKLGCNDEIKNLLPSIKGAICEDLIYKMNYSQEKAAALLGITQPMVSKYIHRRYSANLKITISRIKNNKMYIRAIDGFIKGGGNADVDSLINALLFDKEFVDELRTSESSLK
ncbi:XRE family transcriptional regulator [Candidatus Mancarchaeum acidiphilum]|uniref:XRE family transcriptional regulator n=1 Tax=Candidatus Mancarchaeum acidiphilum TaxID=1920749 RepID=A0A218NNG7_9ARCH|nr:hypothetical protein [Candidatus Mancarchaeum acidiphilum]ASI14011.1 XRE family transcriptional regulator [Candidatus Mancarchaeum acidiphilum]